MRRIFLIAGLSLAVVALSFALAGPLMSQVEEPRYDVERSEGPIEIRAYPSLVVASTRVRGARRAAISDGFKILAGYIFGGNAASQKVAMTAPVMQQRAPLGPAATQAVETASGDWTVRFVMPRAWSLDSLPPPKDGRVTLTKVPAATFAVIRFSGLARDAQLKAETEALMTFVTRNDLDPRGAPIFAFYNPPWTLPLFRRNEIMIEVRPR